MDSKSKSISMPAGVKGSTTVSDKFKSVTMLPKVTKTVKVG